MTINGITQVAAHLGKGEVVSSILTGSTSCYVFPRSARPLWPDVIGSTQWV